ncbi:MAG: hypothetical protein ABI054_09380 [Planctomycetota bacterium]
MKWLFVAALLAYPLLVFAGLHWLEPRLIGLCVGALFVARLFTSRTSIVRERRGLAIPALAVVAILVLLAARSNDPRYLFLLPAWINAALLVAFGASLWRPPPIVETFARLQAGSLSSEEVAYCRTVTGVWCVFFLLNGTAIVWLALRGQPGQWATYTGLVSYLLVGALFSAEYVYRHYRFRRYLGAPTDALLRRFFPPHEAPGGPR